MENNNKPINGYTAFIKDGDTLYDRYGDEYHEGDILHTFGVVRFHQNGFHFCQKLEDTLRYVNGFQDNVVIAKVLGFGKINEYQDDYYEYGKMYATSDLKISKVYSREELIDEVIKSSHNLKRFIEGYSLTLEELYKLIEASKNSKDVRMAALVHVATHNTFEFNTFIDKIDISDEEIAFILKYIQFINISDDQKNFIRASLGTQLQKDKVRVRK